MRRRQHEAFFVELRCTLLFALIMAQHRKEKQKLSLELKERIVMRKCQVIAFAVLSHGLFRALELD